MVRSNTPRTARTAAEHDASIARLLFEPTIRARDSIRAEFRFPRDSVSARQIIAHALTVGVPAAAAKWMTDDLHGRSRAPLTMDDWRVIRRWLFDATAARRVGVDRELLAVSLIDGLTHTPPVLSSPSVPPICEPTLCRAMANEVIRAATALPTSAQPVRAVALVAAMVTTPRGWTDSVIANAAHNPLLATRALWFACGTSSTAAASAKAPVPGPNAAASVWRYWLTGQDSAYLQSRGAVPVPRTPARSSVVNYSSEQAATSIRFAEVRTGQPYATALRRHRAAATCDSTRALFGMLLMAIGESVFTTSELVSLVFAPPSDERALAISQIAGLRRVFEPRQQLAPDSVATLIGMRVIESLYANRPLSYVGDTARRLGFFALPPVVDSVPQYLSMDLVPDVVRQRAAALGHAPVARGWTFLSGSTGTTTHVSPVRGVGPFYSIDVTYTTLYARGGARSGGYASGHTLWFVEGPQGCGRLLFPFVGHVECSVNFHTTSKRIGHDEHPDTAARSDSADTRRDARLGRLVAAGGSGGGVTRVDRQSSDL